MLWKENMYSNKKVNWVLGITNYLGNRGFLFWKIPFLNDIYSQFKEDFYMEEVNLKCEIKVNRFSISRKSLLLVNILRTPTPLKKQIVQDKVQYSLQITLLLCSCTKSTFTVFTVTPVKSTSNVMMECLKYP